MKRYFLIILSTLLILTGCISKSSFSTTFDGFTIKFYDNNKKYIAVPWDASLDMKILTEMKEQVVQGDSGFINSLIIAKLPIQSWTDIKALVDANMNTLWIKLFKYASLSHANKKVKCNAMQYSWYTTSFSYQLDNETLYEWQFFFGDGDSLYVLSLSSDANNDIKAFIKSVGTIACI